MRSRRTGAHAVLITTVVILTLTSMVTCALATLIEFPLNLDYLLLDAAVKQRFYGGPNGRAQFWNGDNNCGHFYAINPRFSRSRADVQLESEGNLEAAVTLAGQCLNAMSWHGNLVALTKPWMAGCALKFRITDLNFYTANGIAISNGAFDLIKSGLIDQLGNFSYDLGPQLRQLQTLANGLSSTPDITELKAALASIRAAGQVIRRTMP